MTHPGGGSGGTGPGGGSGTGPGREIQTFEYGDLPVRTVTVGGEPWFVGRDACEALAIADARSSLNLLDDDERDSIPVTDHLGRSQQTIIISEAGLYSLILRSRKPEAKAFKRWITHEVLPSIRRTGTYTAPAAELDELEVARRYVLALEAKKELEATVAEQRSQLAVAQPKADYVDSFVNPAEDTSTIRVFAGQLGVGEDALRNWLVARKVIYRRLVGERWSGKKQRMEPEYEWLAYSGYRSWFTPVDQPNAPRMHNGQMRTTLYVTPVGKVQIRRLLMKHPIDSAEPQSA